MDRQEQRRSRHQQLVVHVAAMDGWRRRVIAPKGRRWGDSDRTEERMQRHLDARRDPADHARAIERHDLDPAIRKVIGQKASRRPEGIVGIGDGQIDLLNTDFQRIARLCALDGDRPGEDVATGPASGQRHTIEHRA
jgi:hypothetical protein